MMNNKHIERSIIQGHLASEQSTHGTAPQVSAARLIRLLRDAYPLVCTNKLTSDSTEIEASASAAAAIEPKNGLISEKDAQIFLISYLSSLNEAEEAKVSDEEDYQIRDFDAALSHPSTTFTIHLITAIKKRHEAGLISAEDFRIICQQMKLLAGTCPGINWDNNHKQWSTNAIYNAASDTEEQVLASPAETLNLLARALLDKDRYKEHPEALRLSSFCNCLIALGKRGLAVCSTGQQHELLFLLNQSYLDKPLAQGGEPIRMYESASAFVASAFSSYLENQLNKVSPLDRITLILEEFQWDGASEVPLINYLKSHAEDGDWKAPCRAVLEEACKSFGLQPSSTQTTISLFLEDENLAYVSLPTGSITIVPALREIFEFSIPKGQPLRDRQLFFSNKKVSLNSALYITRNGLTYRF